MVKADKTIETAYAVSFWGLQVWSFGSALTFWFALDPGNAVADDKLVGPFVRFWLMFQLLRMYYVLHTFEREIDVSGVSHFLESVTGKAKVFERVIRVILATLLVVLSKVRSETLFPAAALATCFFLLLVWDLIVWGQLKDKPLTGKPRTTALRFFYLQHNDSQLNGFYFRSSLKAWERTAGLFGAVLGVAFLIGGDRYVGELFLMVAAVGFFGIYMAGFYLEHKTLRGIAAELGKVFFGPIVGFFELFWGKQFMDTNKKKANWTAALLLGVLVGTAYFTTACGTSPASGDKATLPVTVADVRIRVATSKNLWCSLTLVANKQGFFRDEHLVVEPTYQAAGRLNMDALLGGAVDIANVVETNVAYQALNATSDLAIEGAIVTARDYAILTKSASHIAKSGDFKGKSLAYSQATGAESFVFWFLESQGIAIASVKLKPLQPAGLVDGFIGQPTDAVAAWEPFVSTIRSRPVELGPTFDAGTTGFAGLMFVAAKKSWADANKDALEAYERAMNRAAKLVVDDPGLAQKLVSEEVGLPIETVRNIWARFGFEYRNGTAQDVVLIEQVIERIRRNVPGMKERQAVAVASYFPSVKPK